MAKKKSKDADEAPEKDAKKKKKKGKANSPVKPLRFGTLTALLITGPMLWPQVSSAQITPEAALMKFAMVAAACTIGFTLVRGLVTDYQTDVLVRERAKEARRREVLAFIEAENRAKAHAEAVEALEAKIAERAARRASH